MANEWAEVPLKQVSKLITKGTTPTTLGMQFSSQGINFIKAESVTGDGWIDRSKFAFIDDKTHEALRRSQIEPDDLLMSMAGVYLGKVAVVPTDLVPANTNQALAIIRLEKSAADPRFVAYYLRNPEFNIYINNLVAQSAQPNLNLGEIGNLPIRLPSVSEQRAIAHILGTLDNKIEMNRRMNETLEGMARAIFKSWFVDFGPVRAKAEGRDPSLPKPIVDLFPDRFEDSELGEIPVGWKVAEVGDIADVIDCLHSKKPERCDTGYPYLQLSNIRDDGLIDIGDTYYINEADYQKWISRMEATKGDCVITNVGRVGAVAQIPGGLKAALGRNMTGIRSKPAFPFPTFLIECLLSDVMRAEITRKMDSGTILNALNVRNIPKLRCVLADARVIARFEQVSRPLRQKMEQNLLESRTLAAMRDTLLPKLISGELRLGGTLKVASA